MTITRSDSPPGSGFNVGVNEILSILLERIWILVLCMIVGGVAGYSTWMNSPKVYSSTTQLLVTTARKNVVGSKIQDVDNDDARNGVNMNTDVDLICSKAVAERVVARLNLTEDPEFLLGEKPGTHLTASAAAAKVKDAISASVQPNTNLILLMAKHRSPAMTQKLADTAAEEFIAKNIADRSEASKQALDFLFDQAGQMDKNLHQSAMELQKFRETNSTVVFDPEEWKDLNSKFNELRKNRLILEGDLHAVEGMGKNYDLEKLLALESVKTDPTVQTLLASISNKKEKYSIMSRDLQDGNPMLTAARSDIEYLQKTLFVAAVQAAQGLQERYQAAVTQEKQLETSVQKRNREMAQFDALQRDLDQNVDLSKNLRDRIKDTEVAKALDADDIKIAENASPPIQVEPSGKKIMLEYLGAGVILGVLIAFALNLFDNSIKTPDQIESSLHLPALSVVPEAPYKEEVPSDSTSQDALNPAVREAFRSLVVSMKLLGRKGEGKSFLFTSALPAEGKTFCSYHTSLQMVAQGHKVVLIDADLRKPLLHKLVPGARLENGLSDVLADQLSIDDAIQETMNENFSFISAGMRSPNPQKLLASTALPDVIAQLGKRFEYIIIDSAPVNAVADTLLIALHVQRVCLIARAGSTPERAVIRAIQALFSSSEKQPSGVVLNRYKRRRGLYYYYNYSYHKSYGYYGAYGEGNDKGSEDDEKAS